MAEWYSYVYNHIFFIPSFTGPSPPPTLQSFSGETFIWIVSGWLWASLLILTSGQAARSAAQGEP